MANMSDPVSAAEFDQLQSELDAVYSLNSPESTTPHVIVPMPSFSLGEGLLSHYGGRLASLEHRFLVGVFTLRMPAARLVYVCSAEPAPEVIDHYFSLLPDPQNARDRFRLVVVEDSSTRPVAAKLLERPDLLDGITAWIGDDPAYIEPWNVAAAEQRLALRLGLPILGSAPDVWPLGFKSAGRRVFREAGVPVPDGIEDLTTVAEAVDAIDQLRANRDDLPAVILKHDDSGAGDGNAVIHTNDLDRAGTASSRRRVLSRINHLEPWYLDTLELGFVAESRIVGEQFSSPSAQAEIRPDGSAVILSTHEQILTEDDQVYLGCRFPANPDYAARLGAHARTAAGVIASKGGLGRLGIDFVTARSGTDDWSVHAIEINLRKPGTSHPYSALRHLAPGRYDVDAGTYTDDRGQAKFYVASDNLVEENWTGIAEVDVIAAIRDAGLSFDTSSRTGVVPHMLSCLAIDGRFGLTAIANSPAQAEELQEATVSAMRALAASYH